MAIETRSNLRTVLGDWVLSDWIAFYGSLMQGLGGLDKLGLGDQLRFAGPCLIAGELFDLGAYPGLRRGSGRVIGELYAIRGADVLARLDEFEAFDPERPSQSLYLRERTALIRPARTEAWLYIYNGSNGLPDPSTRIPSGDWRAHLTARST